nr:RidA family protein [Azospirillum melinis]
MSQAVVHNGTVFLAGQVAEDAPGADVAQQTCNVLDRIDALLAEVGTDKTKLLSATIWLSNMASFGAMNEVWDSWVAPGCEPARATVESRLASPEYAVEIAVVAAL